MGTRWRRVAVAGAGLAFLAPGTASGQTVGAPVTPITGDPVGTAPAFEGAAAKAKPIKGVAKPPRHPYMAANGRSNIHNDAHQTDVYRFDGPLGDGAETSTLLNRECASVLFDRAGRIVTICVGLDQPVLALLDPDSLEALAAMPLPPRAPSADPFSDFSGGGYFYLDHRDRAVFATSERDVRVVGVSAGPAFSMVREYDLSGVVPQDDAILSVLPDWDGRIWFVTRGALVGAVDRASGRAKVRRLAREGISNSFAVDETGGVFVVSDRALYRFDASRKGRPRVTWRRSYPNSGIEKPGQSDAGSGTTPTLMGRRWVAITDNADPMNVRVYRRKRGSKGSPVCARSVFAKGASATDQSLIAAGRSLVTENNYGYSVAATEMGGSTSPGLARVDVRKRKGKRGFRCVAVWTSRERAPSVVPKLSLAAGLVYTYTKPALHSGEDPWYLTALDFRTGKTVYRRLAGRGFGFNNNYAPVTIAPDGTAYVGVLGGLVALE